VFAKQSNVSIPGLDIPERRRLKGSKAPPVALVNSLLIWLTASPRVRMGSLILFFVVRLGIWQ
jgi:hypothetical protein